MKLCNQVCRWNTYADGCTKPFEAICPLSNMKVGEDTNVITNADHIRSMSDEELANFLAEEVNGCMRHTEVCEVNDTCNGCFGRWLKQPYKEDT